MKQFLFVTLFITIFVSMTEAKVQRASSPSTTRLWSQPFIRPQLFNVRQVLERTNYDLYHTESVVSKNKESSSCPSSKTNTQRSSSKSMQSCDWDSTLVFM